MTPIRTVRVIAVALAVAVALPAVAAAQTSRTATSPTTAGAFDRLSEGNQKIARALFEAQDRSTTPGTTKLTLDQIAAMKKGEGGWGRVFKDMKTRGLVEEKNLGQVVSRHERDHDRSDRADKDRDDKGRGDKGRDKGRDKDRVEKDHRDRDRDDRPGRAEHRDRTERGGRGNGRGR